LEKTKYEYIYLNHEKGNEELYEGVRKYIDFYNKERKHKSIVILKLDKCVE
jgi:putative transposase